MAIDAEDTDRLAKYCNHNQEGNCAAHRERNSEGEVEIIIKASRDISEGEELTFPYGDTRKEVLAENPWLDPSKATAEEPTVPQDPAEPCPPEESEGEAPESAPQESQHGDTEGGIAAAAEKEKERPLPSPLGEPQEPNPGPSKTSSPEKVVPKRKGKGKQTRKGKGKMPEPTSQEEVRYSVFLKILTMLSATCT